MIEWSWGSSDRLQSNSVNHGPKVAEGAKKGLFLLIGFIVEVLENCIFIARRVKRPCLGIKHDSLLLLKHSDCKGINLHSKC